MRTRDRDCAAGTYELRPGVTFGLYELAAAGGGGGIAAATGADTVALVPTLEVPLAAAPTAAPACAPTDMGAPWCGRASCDAGSASLLYTALRPPAFAAEPPMPLPLPLPLPPPPVLDDADVLGRYGLGTDPPARVCAPTAGPRAALVPYTGRPYVGAGNGGLGLVWRPYAAPRGPTALPCLPYGWRGTYGRRWGAADGPLLGPPAPLLGRLPPPVTWDSVKGCTTPRCAGL